MPCTDQLREGWEHANDCAREAEVELADTWARFVAGEGLPPGTELLEEVGRLRHQCDERLKVVLGEFESSLPPPSGG